MKEILVNVERCNGCLNCTVACATAHSPSKDILTALINKEQARLSVQAVKGRPVPVMCRHCAEPACVEACMAGAMQKDPVTGIVSNEGNEQQCVGCWMCVMACPYGAIVQKQGPDRVALKCDRCKGREVPACVESCPNGALVYTEVDRFSEDRRQKTAQAMCAEPA